MKVTEAKLGDAEPGAYGSMKFIVSIPDENGVPRKKKSVCAVKGTLYEQYKNKRVKVCYLDDRDFIFIVDEKFPDNEI